MNFPTDTTRNVSIKKHFVMGTVCIRVSLYLSDLCFLRKSHRLRLKGLVFHHHVDAPIFFPARIRVMFIILYFLLSLHYHIFHYGACTDYPIKQKAFVSPTQSKQVRSQSMEVETSMVQASNAGTLPMCWSTL